MNSRLVWLAALAACTTDDAIDQVGINEIASAQSDADWVEVMNVTDKPMSLAGWTVEVDGEPMSFEDTALDAGAFAVLSDLALSDDGGELTLIDPDDRVVDVVMFPAMTPEEGYGRLPDAAPNWQRLPMVTPGSSNR
ncbi:MAG: hypothetical protein AAGA48_02955 [Myxococcota bacterium]